LEKLAAGQLMVLKFCAGDCIYGYTNCCGCAKLTTATATALEQQQHGSSNNSNMSNNKSDNNSNNNSSFSQLLARFVNTAMLSRVFPGDT